MHISHRLATIQDARQAAQSVRRGSPLIVGPSIAGKIGLLDRRCEDAFGDVVSDYAGGS